MSVRDRACLLALVITAVLAWPSATRAGTCTVSSVSPVAFGSYDVFDPAPVDSTGSITIDCTDIVAEDVVRVDLDAGASGTFAARTLVSGALTMIYGLYLDAAHTLVWGDGTGGSSTYGPVHPAEGPTTLTIYGRIPGNQDVGGGVYADTITVTLQF